MMVPLALVSDQPSCRTRAAVRVGPLAFFLILALRPTPAPASRLLPPTAADTSCVNDPSWIAPQPPFRIHGNTWHVGPRGLGVFLLTAPMGHVLIDGGVPGHTALITANIRRLGFDPRDVKWIVNTQAHCDHAGGIAQLARETGAAVIAGAADSALLARGGRGDPQYGDAFPFPPVRVTRTVADGEHLQLGDLVLTAHATPGHTPGNTSWTWRSCEGTRCVQVADVGSLSAPDYRLVDNPAYPGLVADYEASFQRVASLPCDLALAPHPGMVDFWERVAQRERGNAQALIDSTRCRRYSDAARKGFEEELARQRRPPALSPRFNHVMLFVTSLDSSVAFYTAAFDLTVTQRLSELTVTGPDGTPTVRPVRMALLKFPGQEFVLELAERPPAAAGPAPHFQHLGVDVRDIAAAAERVRKAGGQSPSPIQTVRTSTGTVAKNMFFRGPNGELVELMEIVSGEF